MLSLTMTSSTATAHVAEDSPLDRLFLEARTFSSWLDRPVSEATLRQVYELSRMAPTAANSHPGRVTFVVSAEAKERLRPALSAGNVDKTMRAPATAIVAFDTKFHEQMPKLFPARPEMGATFAAMPEAKRDPFLRQNSTLLAGYLIMAARALGLDCGPMGGFVPEQVDAAFFAELPWKSILLVNLGYGDPSSLHPRNPRLSVDDACRIV
jgi:3-hydroxypropanoate dehydrogenase